MAPDTNRAHQGRIWEVRSAAATISATSCFRDKGVWFLRRVEGKLRLAAIWQRLSAVLREHRQAQSDTITHARTVRGNLKGSVPVALIGRATL